MRATDRELKVEQSGCVAGNRMVTAVNMTAQQRRKEETIKSRAAVIHLDVATKAAENI